MALGASILSKARAILNPAHNPNRTANTTDHGLNTTNVNLDPEKANRTMELYDPENITIGGRRLKRVEAPLLRRGQDSPTSSPDDSSAEFSVGKQIEKEAGNAIQYRSCSWHKVCFCIP
jgi:hypothetical protein